MVVPAGLDSLVCRSNPVPYSVLLAAIQEFEAAIYGLAKKVCLIQIGEMSDYFFRSGHLGRSPHRRVGSGHKSGTKEHS
jgi:hypothetical protein